MRSGPSPELLSPELATAHLFKGDPLRQLLLALHEPRLRGERLGLDDLAWREALTAVWRGRRVAVWGAAITGVAAAQLLAELGAEVTLSDSRTLERPAELHPAVRLVTGQPNSWEGAELIIPSPGLKPTHPLLIAAREAGAPLMSEVELAAWCTRARLIAVTGTDGKSTTTCLIAHLLRGVGLQVWAVGNLGEPVSVRALEARAEDALVCELSAFQLWSTLYFPAELSVITNIAEDHLDYFEGDFERYRASKERLAHLGALSGGLTLTPHQLTLSAEAPSDLPTAPQPSLKRFAVRADLEPPPTDELELYVERDQLKERGAPIADLSSAPLIGRHNQLNICAALLALRSLDLPVSEALSALSSFKGLPHRMALIGERGGARWVNDSKATNVHASLAGLMSVDDRLIIIAGGKEKGLDYQALVRHLTDRSTQGLLSRVLLIGELAPRLAQELSQGGLGALTERCDSLEVAVARASALAQPNEMVILSPASSSFDQFKSFEARGERFEGLFAQLR